MWERLIPFKPKSVVFRTGLYLRTAYVCVSCGWIQENAAKGACEKCSAHDVIPLTKRMKDDREIISRQRAIIAELRTKLSTCVTRKIVAINGGVPRAVQSIK